jgi:hypothetical protein
VRALWTFVSRKNEEMQDKDEITAAEDAIIAGREMKVGKKKKDLMLEEKDAESIELAKEDYRRKLTFLR